MLSIILRFLLPFLGFLVVYLIVRGFIKLFRRFPRLKTSQKVAGYLFASFMTVAVIGAVVWPVFVPGLYHWLEGMPTWVKDINVSGSN